MAYFKRMKGTVMLERSKPLYGAIEAEGPNSFVQLDQV